MAPLSHILNSSPKSNPDDPPAAQADPVAVIAAPPGQHATIEVETSLPPSGGDTGIGCEEKDFLTVQLERQYGFRCRLCSWQRVLFLFAKWNECTF